MWNIFFQNFAVYYLFFYFCIIFDILFSISSIWTCQQILEILMLFYLMDLRFYKRILKIMEYFKKKIDIWNPKCFINSIVCYLFFFSFIILVIFFFLFHLSKLVKKILKIFVVLYCTHYRFYQRILENSWIFIKKKIL